MKAISGFFPGLFLVAVLTLSACGAGGSAGGGEIADPSTSSTTSPGPSDAGEPGQADEEGRLSIGLESIDGYFIEGFEIGLRIEDANGEPVYKGLWTEFVVEEGDGSIDAFYDSVLTHSLEPGEYTVWATVNVGAGPPPETPDVDGDLACDLPVTVEPAGEVVVEVNFSGANDCLTLAE